MTDDILQLLSVAPYTMEPAEGSDLFCGDISGLLLGLMRTWISREVVVIRVYFLLEWLKGSQARFAQKS